MLEKTSQNLSYVVDAQRHHKQALLHCCTAALLDLGNPSITRSKRPLQFDVHIYI